ncbi:MAG: SRPBCC family protein [Hyphomicrobium sp.]
MTERSVAHGSFTVERTYPASPARVFNAWADPAIKRRWYGGSGQEGHVFEFEPGGREVHAGTGPEGQPYVFESRYYDIVPDRRIVYAYEVKIGGVLHSVSIAAVQLRAAGSGTTVTVTEQGAFLDGHEIPDERIGGTNWVLDRLGEILAEDA